LSVSSLVTLALLTRPEKENDDCYSEGKEEEEWAGKLSTRGGTLISRAKDVEDKNVGSFPSLLHPRGRGRGQAKRDLPGKWGAIADPPSLFSLQ